jgi:DNA end-binding protein Ku
MAMRATQNLSINLGGLIVFPVKVFKATTETSEGIGFRQIHSTCGKPINQVKRCQHCAVEVPMTDLLKGYDDGSGGFLKFTEDEIKALKPEAAQSITIEGYLAADEIDASFQDGSVYYMSPDRGDKKVKASCDAFVTWRDALDGRWAIGKVVMYGRERVVAIRAVERVLALHFIRTSTEIRDIAEIPGYKDVPDEASRDHLAMMNQFIDQKEISFHDVVLESDAYADAVKALIEARKSGQPDPKQPAAPVPTSGGDLMALLQASLAKK